MDLVSLFELFFIVFFGGGCLICFFFRYRYGNVRGVDFGFFLMFLYCSDLFNYDGMVFQIDFRVFCYGLGLVQCEIINICGFLMFVDFVGIFY